MTDQVPLRAFQAHPGNFQSGETVGVSHGGTGAATLVAHGVVIGNGTSAVNVTGAGTSGDVLTSNGAGSDPTFQPVSVSLSSLPNIGSGDLVANSTASYYLDTSGAAPSASGNYQQAVGRAVSPTALVFNPQVTGMGV